MTLRTPTMENCRFQMRMDNWDATVICLFQTDGPRFRAGARWICPIGYRPSNVDTIDLARVLEDAALADVQRQVEAHRSATEPYPND